MRSSALLLTVFVLNICIVFLSLAQSKENEINENANKEIISQAFTDQGDIMMQLIPSSVAGKNGYLNEVGQLIIPRVFDRAESFIDGLAIVSVNQQYGVIDRFGKFVIPLKYLHIALDNSKKYFIVNDKDFFGILNNLGEVVLPFIYTNMNQQDNDRFLVNVGTYGKNKWGLYSITSKKYLLRPQYTSIILKANFFECMKENRLIDLYNSKTLLLVDSSYSKIEAISSDYYLVNKDGLWGMVSSHNEIKIPFVYHELKSEYGLSNCFIARKHDKYGVVAYDNKIIVDFIYSSINEEKNLLLVSENSKYGIIDKLTFKETLPCIYSEILIYDSEHILAQKNELYGLIKYDGHVLEDFNFTVLKSSTGHYRVYQKGAEFGFLDLNYNLLKQPTFDSIKEILGEVSSVRYFACRKGNVISLYNFQGAILGALAGYDDILRVRNQFIITVKNHKYGLYDLNTKKEVLKPQYDLVVFEQDGNCLVSDNGKYYHLLYIPENKVSLVPLD